GFREMALGSLATATKLSPSPVARAPSPILRKVPEAVPARCCPSVNWAAAGPTAVTATHAASASAMSAARRGRLEIDVKRDSPLRLGTVVRRVVHFRLLRVAV